MAGKRTFNSFDFENDGDLRTLLVGQAKYTDTPFEIADWSVKEKMEGDWKNKVRERIKKTALVIVICGENTDKATGVSVELNIAQEEEIDYFLLKGRKNKTCIKPTAAKSTDKIYNWTWENLKILVGGDR